MRKLVKGVNSVVTVIALVFVVAMLFVVVANILLRYVFKHPITGATEITSMLMCCMLMCAAPALLRGQHVWIDLITSKFGRKASIVLDLVTLTLAAVFSVLCLWPSFSKWFVPELQIRDIRFLIFHFGLLCAFSGLRFQFLQSRLSST